MWFRIVSWHIVKETVRPDTYKTYCGHIRQATLSDRPDPDGKTCESCFRHREARR